MPDGEGTVSQPTLHPADVERWRAFRVDLPTAEKRAARARTRSIKTDTKERLLRIALSCVDLTTLTGQDTPGRVRSLCRKALTPLQERPDLPSCAAVCVYPNMVPWAREALGDHSPVRLAAVATGFPAGLIPLDLKLEETRRTVEMGADEIDMVIDRGAFLAGDWDKVFEEIRLTKEACGPAALKVILETGELGTLDHVAQASRLAIAAGADFIKTSTGKVDPAATLPVTLVMMEAVREHYLATGIKVGIKPAGGIKTAKDAVHYLVLLGETLGTDWLGPDLWRFGASSLANDLLRQLVRRAEGTYPSPRRFSVD